jgi:energy-converting hydrogenase Eha subunit E
MFNPEARLVGVPSLLKIAAKVVAYCLHKELPHIGVHFFFLSYDTQGHVSQVSSTAG